MERETQIYNSRNEKEEIIRDIITVKMIIKEYFEQVYANKVDNLDEMDNFM